MKVFNITRSILRNKTSSSVRVWASAFLCRDHSGEIIIIGLLGNLQSALVTKRTQLQPPTTLRINFLCDAVSVCQWSLSLLGLSKRFQDFKAHFELLNKKLVNLFTGIKKYIYSVTTYAQKMELPAVWHPVQKNKERPSFRRIVESVPPVHRTFNLNV